MTSAAGSRSIVRGRTAILGIEDRDRVVELQDGAVLQEDGTIVDVDTYATLKRRHPGVPVLGDGTHVLMPGLIDAHHHVGLTPVQLGSPDLPLELWMAARLVARAVDPYLDTLYSAFELIGSGVTTVQHISGWLPGDATAVRESIDRVLAAYRDIGMRASFCHAVRDQNRLGYLSDDALIASLPKDARPSARRWFDRFEIGVDEALDIYAALRQAYRKDRRIRIQLAPANLHWCSDETLRRLGELSAAGSVPMHMHLSETIYQQEYARRRSGGTPVDHLERLGLLSERLTIGHGVHLSESDMDLLADRGVSVCHNGSSNLRLRSGIAPLAGLERRGVNTAIGIDEAGINDDRDMLQEMRVVLNLHRVPGMRDEDVPTPGQVLRMATTGGAKTTPWADRIGVLQPGRAADLVLLDWEDIARPYLDELTPVAAAVVHRAKTGAVRLTMCDGEVLYRNGTFTRVERGAVLGALHALLSRELSDDERDRRRLAESLLPRLRDFYAGYLPDRDARRSPRPAPSRG